MKILCDTCCVLLLIRIVPRMFIDEKFKCLAIREVREEIFQTQRFKSRYPWRNDFRDSIGCEIPSQAVRKKADMYFSVIDKKIESGTINNRNGRFFDLSYKDKRIVAYALATDSLLATNDYDMRDFVHQEFDSLSLSSLGLVNKWIKEGALTWYPEYQKIIEDWNICNEPKQPIEDVEEFQRLSKFDYIGP